MATVAPDRCPTCGAERPADAPRGHCPRCLLRGGLDSDAPGLSHPVEAGITVDFASDPSVLGTLAATIGPVSRILLRDTDAGPEPPLHRPASPEMPAPADRSARLHLFGEIARGGMGAILKGRDEDLGRDLAVKVLLEAHRDKPDLIRRFVEEAQIGGQLQHPGIVPIYELGAFADRRPYFAMKLVKGRTLTALLADRSSPADGLPKYLGIFEQVCQTVAYAHARGVIHRDLKPSNIMVGGFGEVQVMDWGLAKVLPRGGVADDQSAGKRGDAETIVATARSGSDSDLSRAGSVMGTPSYMAPEQARGEVEAIDERADVFALGSILCEVLTGSPAFTGRSSAEIQRRAARGDLADALARLDACGADAELIGLARSCLAVEPEDRPRDAGAVTERITAHLTGVQERLRAAEIERARAEARAVEERKRRKLQVGLAASVLALTTLGGLSFTYMLHQRQTRAARVDRLLAEATLLRDQARTQPDDVARWEQARDALARIADDLDAGAGPAARAPVVALRQEIQGGLVAAEADRVLMEQLVDIRSAQADDPDGSATDAAYADAFRSAGLDPDAPDPIEAGARIARRPEAVARALVAALDHWAALRRMQDPRGGGWTRLLAAARAADPDPDRDALCAALLIEDKAERLERLRPLAERADSESWAPASLVLLGGSLGDAGDVDAGVAVLRRASGAHPRDARLHYALGRLLERVRPPDPEEAIRAYSVARALQPELAAHELAHALERRGRGEEAVAVWRDLAGRRPDNGRHLVCYGILLKERGRAAEAVAVLDRAIAALRAAIRLDPDLAEAHSNLGLALADQGKLDEAIAAYRAAIRLDPDLAEAHSNLGLALMNQGKSDEAITAYREAIRLKPDLAEAHNNLGNALADQGKPDEAITAYRAAIRLDPDLAEAHSNLGLALADQGKPDEAIAECRAAIRIDPDNAENHYCLGNTLLAQGQHDEAIAAYHEAIGLAPDYAEAHCNLGHTLRRIGDFAESLVELRRGHELGSQRPGWTYPSAEWVRQAERLAALAERLPAVLSGETEPTDNAERLALAQMCYDTKRHAAAARLWAEAMESDPSLADDLNVGHRYNAACAAALAGCGEGQDDPPPDDDGRAELRGRALDWLRADLAAWAEQFQADAIAARGALTHWKGDPDLAGIRDPDALAGLPEPERADWQALWAEVDRLLEESTGTP